MAIALFGEGPTARAGPSWGRSGLGPPQKLGTAAASAWTSRQPRIYRESIESALEPGNTLMFAHGFSIHYGTVVPPEGVDVSMV
ncbi:MAG: hypothetical protein ACPGVJ_04245, partial [Mangrovicoccus sp.]